MISIPSILKAFWLVVLFNGNPVTLNTQASNDYIARVAWNATGQRVRYVPFAASDSMLAKLLDRTERTFYSGNRVDWAPALNCAFDKDVLNDVYFINCGQTVIFTKEPCDPDYTPLWRVHYMEFCGIPYPPTVNTLEQVEDFIASGELVQTAPDSVLDATIVINSEGKVLPQVLDFDRQHSRVELPLIPVFSKFPNEPRPFVSFISFTDTSDEVLAIRLGANFTPRLKNLATDCCDPVFAFVNPVAPGQLPIVRNIPEYRYSDWLQINQDYNPMRCWNLFSREAPPCGTGTNPVINNEATLQFLVEQGIIFPVELDEPIVTNSPTVFPMSVWQL